MEEKKYRHELKFVCSEQQLCMLENRIKDVCRPDAYSGEDGKYIIQSVYFDDYHNSCFYENEDGTDPREKFRIRIYNGRLNRIALECKQKQRGMNHKDSCLLSQENCQCILNGMWRPAEVLAETGGDALLRKFALQYQLRMLRAKIIVQYERKPYIYATGNVRITFDRNISVSDNIENFGSDNLRLRPVMPVGQHILEVKYDELLPDYIHSLLQLEGLRQTSYSKYYTCRKFCF